MILAFPANGNNVDADIDQRFGRCKYFVAYDTETKEVKYTSNDQNIHAAQGAGIQSATHVVNMGAEVLITGHCGPKAFKVCEVAKVKVITGVSGSIKEAITRYMSGELHPASAADVEGHWV